MYIANINFHQNFFRARIPVASAVTALEIWLLACILLVFGALAEYAFILRQVINLSRQQRRLRLRMQLENPGSFNHPNYNSPPAVFAPGKSIQCLILSILNLVNNNTIIVNYLGNL